MPLKRGAIVLVSFPFSDLSLRKIRPAIIISPETQGEDIILAAISSVLSKVKLLPTEFLLEYTHPDFAKTGLKKNSVFKLNKLLTLHHSLILRQLGVVSKHLQHEIDQCLAKAVGLAR